MRGLFIFVCFLCLFASCRERTASPKPTGFYRIEIPKAHYVDFTSEELPYSFVVSQLVTVELPMTDASDNWINLAYESLNAKIYCSYEKMEEGEFPTFDQECRELVARSARNANRIQEQLYENPEINVYGTLFTIEGEASSPVQFMLTDSLHHFFRGALYYQCPLNVDSLAPVTTYLRHDIVELIHSFHWK